MDENELLRFCKIGKHGPYDIIDSRVAEYVTSRNHIMIVLGQAYIYQNGVFRLDKSGLFIQHLIKQCILNELVSNARIERVFKLILKDFRLQVEPEDINRYSNYWINFKNGMLDVQTGEMHEHSPKYRSISQIPHNYKPGLDVTKTVFYKFIQSRIPDEENQRMLFEFMGMCLLPSIIFAKFLILVGKGNAGKSVILNHVSRLVGAENIAAVPLHLLSERFTTASLLFKTVNICGDLSVTAIRDSAMIKQLTGLDMIKAEYKGKDIFFFRNRAKFLFSCNELPSILDDRSNGFYRRLLVIRFENEGEFFPNLFDQLSDEDEIEALISHIVEGAKTSLNRGKIYESGASKGEVLNLRRESDSVEAFFDECIELDEKSKIRRPDLFIAYENFCRQEERTPLRKTAFFKALRTKGHREGKVRGNIYVYGLHAKFIETDETPFK